MINEPKERMMNSQFAKMGFFSWSNALNEKIMPNGSNMKRYGKDIFHITDKIL